MKVLFLSQRVPYPPNRGDKITTWRLIERMARTHEVRIVAFAHDEQDRAGAAELRQRGFLTFTVDHYERQQKLCALPLLFTKRPLTLGVFSSRKLQQEVDQLAGWADVAYAYSSSMGAFLMRHDVPWVMHFAELDSDKWRQYAERAPFPMSLIYRREWRTLLAFEREVARLAHTSVFCTPLEQEIFAREIPGRPSVVLRNGVDLNYYKPTPLRREAGHLVFTGVMDYLPNVDACCYFVREVLPRVRARHPEVRFTIVGSRPNAEVKRLVTTPGVTVTGFVADTREWLARAAISVAPLRIARGIQNKVLEAMAMGLPVVGSTCATQGVEGTAGEHFLVADDAQGQAEAICRLLDRPELALALGASGRRFVEARYDWEVTLEPLERILTSSSKKALLHQ